MRAVLGCVLMSLMLSLPAAAADDAPPEEPQAPEYCFAPGETRECERQLDSGETCKGVQICSAWTWSECRAPCTVDTCGSKSGTAAFVGEKCEDVGPCIPPITLAESTSHDIELADPTWFQRFEPGLACFECAEGQEEACVHTDAEGEQLCEGVRVCREGRWSQCGMKCDIHRALCNGVTIPGHAAYGQTCKVEDASACQPVTPGQQCLLEPTDGTDITFVPVECRHGDVRPCRESEPPTREVWKPCEFQELIKDRFGDILHSCTPILITTPGEVCDGVQVCRYGRWTGCGQLCDSLNCNMDRVQGHREYKGFCGPSIGYCAPVDGLEYCTAK